MPIRGECADRHILAPSSSTTRRGATVARHPDGILQADRSALDLRMHPAIPHSWNPEIAKEDGRANA